MTGQDGSYLTELLLAKGYVVHGARKGDRRVSTASRGAMCLCDGLRAAIVRIRAGAAPRSQLLRVLRAATGTLPLGARCASLCATDAPLRRTVGCRFWRAPGIKRRASSHNQPRLDEALNGHALAHNVVLHYGASVRMHAPSLPVSRASR